MPYPSHRRARVNPELVTAYTVSEAESPAPWSRAPLERHEELRIEEIHIAPPLPRRPDYHRDNYRLGSQMSEERVAAPTSSFDRDRYGRPARGYQVKPEGYNERFSSLEDGWRIQRGRSPQINDSTSTCSASDCEECAYRPKHEYDRPLPRSRNPSPFIIIPGDGIGARASRSRRSPSAAYPVTYDNREPPPRGYQPYTSIQQDYPRQGHPVPMEDFLEDNSSPVAGSHNQIVLFQTTTRSDDSDEERDSEDMHRSNISSPRWSMANQRYMSGSETHSDARSHSPVTSLGGLYELPDPRFSSHPLPRGHLQRPLIITRSNEPRRFEGYGGYKGPYSDASGSDEGYSVSGSSDDREHYPGEYERRYW